VNVQFAVALGSPSWDGSDPVSSDTQVASVISQVRSDGGDVIVSAGGYNGTKLGQVCNSASATAPTPTTTPTPPPGGSGSCAAAWVNNMPYVSGNVASFNGHNWTANQWNYDEVPGGASGAWNDNGAC
jgi:chitinase